MQEKPQLNVSEKKPWSVEQPDIAATPMNLRDVNFDLLISVSGSYIWLFSRNGTPQTRETEEASSRSHREL